MAGQMKQCKAKFQTGVLSKSENVRKGEWKNKWK